VLGTGRSQLTDDAFRSLARENVNQYSRREIDEDTWQRFARQLFFQIAAPDDPGGYHAIKARLEAIDNELGIPGNRIFYLAIPPSLITDCVGHLHAAGLIRRPDEAAFSRVIVEKPIGRDLRSAQHIMVQNHILQLLTLVAMEPPWSLDPDVIRDRRLEVLRSLRPIRGQDVDRQVVRAQYGQGVVESVPVPGYRREGGINSESTTETYVALEVFIDNWRWAGVPFHVRTGKRLPRHVTEISVQFKEVPQILFNANPAARLDPNVLSLRIQPDEGFSLRSLSKVPEAGVRIYPIRMNYQYGSNFEKVTPEAYERLLVDVMAGDATLFMRRDSVEASWSWITPILERWAERTERWLPEYAAGHWGPIEADRLIQTTCRDWLVV